MNSTTKIINLLIEKFDKDNNVEMAIALLQIVSYSEQRRARLPNLDVRSTLKMQKKYCWIF